LFDLGVLHDFEVVGVVLVESGQIDEIIHIGDILTAKFDILIHVSFGSFAGFLFLVDLG